jgi:hypothetical protein
MSARDAMVFAPANEQHRKRTKLDGFLRRYLVRIESSIPANGLQRRDGCRTKQGFTEQRTKLQSGVVVSHFPQTGEGIFGGHCGDAWFDRRGLQRNRRAHRHTQRVQMPDALARVQCIDDRPRVIAFQPAVRGHHAAALPMRA